MIIPKIEISIKPNQIEAATKIFCLRRDMNIAMIEGKVRDFTKLHKEYAKVCVDNFELSKKIPQINTEVDLRSVAIPEGRKIISNFYKVSLLNFFRPKTMKEIMYRKLLWADKMKENYKKAIRITSSNYN